ncbi:CinA family protein [Isoptericola aurantiacus]|uniref:CinA family protein n=1 Tax=Isoptericola aurantiacus TaxID=3377839 RepID=UPI00383A5E29
MSAEVVLESARRRAWTLGVAESLTGGLVAAALVEVPGASRVLRGAVVAYATDLKATLLGVDQELLAERGAVDPDVALAMADGVRRATGAQVGLATTGVAGPDPQDGKEPGLAFVAVVTPRGGRVRRCELSGDRAAVRAGACAAVLDLAAEMCGDQDAR